MDDQLDKDIKKRIHEVFEHYEDTASADDGWLLMRAKLPELQKRRTFLWKWWVAAAAVLLMFFGIGLLVYKQPDTILIKRTIVRSQENQSGDYTSTKPKYTDSNTIAKHADARIARQTQVNAHQEIDFSTSAGVKELKLSKSKSAKLGLNITSGETGDDANQSKLPVSVAPGASAKTLTAITDVDAAKYATKVDDSITNNNKAVIAAQSAKKMDINDLFTKDVKPSTKNNTEETKSKSKKIHLGVYATTYFNYAKGSSNQVNAGLGFSSDVRITNKLQLVTGVAIGQNSLRYAGASTTPAAVASPSIATASYYAKAGFASIATPTVKNYNANLTGLDIPLNIKYAFNPQKNDTYILAGVSSGTFINESYTYLYNYPSVNSTSLQQTQGATTNKSFDSFYLAKALNLAFGIGYPLGKNHLVIEPFLKYPLQGLGYKDISFGAGGVNLKFNFGKGK